MSYPSTTVQLQHDYGTVYQSACTHGGCTMIEIGHQPLDGHRRTVIGCSVSIAGNHEGFMKFSGTLTTTPDFTQITCMSTTSPRISTHLFHAARHHNNLKSSKPLTSILISPSHLTTMPPLRVCLPLMSQVMIRKS